ncbi:MAG TPA: hypothetical protein VGN24_08705 [Rhodanobacter sp.]|jgi:hypothetical protein|nr:hypothetical protein [Rhodanobacter sp.]
MHHAWKCPVAVFLGLLWFGSCSVVANEAAHADAAATAYASWLKDAVASLSAKADTDALLTAGVLARGLPHGGPRSLDLLDKAAASAPQAADIGWLDISACTAQPGCNALKREASMRRVDPRNGIFWIAALRDAWKHADRPRIDAVLARMAQSTGFELHSFAMQQRMLVALERVPPRPHADGALDRKPDVARLVQARLLVLRAAMPPMQDLVEACKPGRTAGGARRKNCRDIARALGHSDLAITKLIGFRLQEWNARDIADRNNAVANRRRLQWKMSQLGDLAASSMSPITRDSTILAYENEVDGIDAALRANGRRLDPPAGWRSVHAKAVSSAKDMH